MNSAILTISDLSVDINDKNILNKISFSAGIGENITILGPNGAGKTTLLKAIAGFIDFSGNILSKGEPVSLMSPRIRASNLSFVAQHPTIEGDFTVRAFIELSRYPYKRPWERLDKNDRTKISEALELTKCSEFVDRKISTLSGGERQRVFIAAAIAQDTAVILFDEPLTHLDPVQRTKISRLISEISGSRGKTVITVTHEINEAVQYSSRIMILNKGKMEFDGVSSDSDFKGILDSVFGTEFISVIHNSTKNSFLFPGKTT